MDGLRHIPTEIVQLLSAAEVAEYKLIPFERTDDVLRCLCIEGDDCSAAVEELSVLNGWNVRTQPVSEGEFRQIFAQYYHSDAVSPKSSARRPADIDTGPAFLLSLIGEAFGCYASDIHFEPYEERCRIRFRIDGKLIERYIVDKSRYAPLINQIKIMSGLDISEKRLPQDGRIMYDRDGAKFDVRVSTLPSIYGEKVVMRLLTRHPELLELKNLGLSERQYEDYCRAISKPFGMVLICGPTGSGKSTTLYATLRRLNRVSENILTIEDPVEYTMDGINQVQLKEEIGLTFAGALRTFLRQDPDIIMLGEVRDPATAEMAVRSALTGHLLFSTIHTNTAWGAVARLQDMGIHPYLISNTLVAAVAQRLVRLLCPHCKREASADADACGIPGELGVSEYYAPVGCERCFYTGYSGRRAVYEVIPIDDELSAAIREGRSDVGDLLRQRGIMSLRDSVTAMFRRGETSLDELIPMLNC
jgi:type II general secretion pathway (GSP) E protein